MLNIIFFKVANIYIIYIYICIYIYIYILYISTKFIIYYYRDICQYVSSKCNLQYCVQTTYLVYLHKYIYIYIYMCVCVCVCMYIYMYVRRTQVSVACVQSMRLRIYSQSNR